MSRVQRLRELEQKIVLCDLEVGRPFARSYEVSRAEYGTDQQRIAAVVSEHLGVALTADKVIPLTRELAVRVAADTFAGSKSANVRERSLAMEFMSMFDVDAQFFSTMAYSVAPNGDLTGKGRYLFDQTLDGGIFVADARSVGVLWVSDED